MRTSTTRMANCAWCGKRCYRIASSGDEQHAYCSRLHQEWADSIARGEYPATECPRCGHGDMRIAGPDWAICQTCGYQTDRSDWPAGALTPRNMNTDMSDTRERLAIDSRRRRL